MNQKPIEKAIPTLAPKFHFAQKDNMEVNIWEMGQIVHKDIAAIPFNHYNKDDIMVTVVIVLDLSKVIINNKCFQQQA